MYVLYEMIHNYTTYFNILYKLFSGPMELPVGKFFHLEGYHIQVSTMLV